MKQRPLRIAGGGLSGLGLGRALARRGVEVDLHEADAYPRHKVCGEFISGLKNDTIQALDLSDILGPAERLTCVRWYLRNASLRTWLLPAPAFGISRHRLDADLAASFCAAGGRLHERSRLRMPPDGSLNNSYEGFIQTTGRLPSPARQQPRWLGLKVHMVPPFSLEADLEVHLGAGAYVGLSRIENGRVNVCGLFQLRPDLNGPAGSLFEQYLTATGLDQLRERIGSGTIDESARSAVAGLDFEQDSHQVPWLRLGDTRGMIPPYTGHGMAMALESAALALDPLTGYARGEISWKIACDMIDTRHERQLRRRLRNARGLHPALYRAPLQYAIGRLTQARLLPLNSLYHLTRG